MKLKEKMKRFLSLDVHGHEGFTLVELIIVIAILAILSGVAIAGYSAYIEKANKAADESLLYEVNLAFQTACIEANIDIMSLSSSDADMPIVNGEIDFANIKPAAIAGVEGIFDDYFDVSNAKFKVIERLRWNGELCKFVDGAGDYGAYNALIESIRAEYGDEIAALAASTFGDAMGMEALMNQLDDVTVLAAGLSSTAAMQNILKSEGFILSAAQSMGLTVDANLGATLEEKLNTLATELSNKTGMSIADAEKQIQANAAVLYTAQQTAKMSVESATELFNTATTEEILKKMTSSDSTTSGEGLAQAALVCGLYTAYVNREGSTATNKEVTVETVLDALQNDKDFKDYLQTEQGQKDIEGYLAALKILNSTTNGQNSEEVDNLMVNGFGDGDLIAGLDSLLG